METFLIKVGLGSSLPKDLAKIAAKMKIQNFTYMFKKNYIKFL